MAEYIERQAAINKIRYRERTYGCVRNTYSNVIKNLPAADVAPVVHGYWKPIYPDKILGRQNRAKYYECSVCGGTLSDEVYSHGLDFNFCPNCGAKMDMDGEAHDP